ncbi:uncharacterized protein PHALS_15184 [Plasmopara halstedii]|uniref:Uncharacterized protein n=1 Tax=Plasmopara halstedii TaxID=4781 RepID=A0A0N7L855_PLAHL|nr:uncharacterized protein PHALS_15184 [Plasmopara halstedii]CEG48931.1 hypothetical protein PHALS_15184 [Plasmopara halstedii]|eukprot:XP_024585300.1 hypothetical protein PHALS_15184 [Plasmopara halstedii]
MLGLSSFHFYHLYRSSARSATRLCASGMYGTISDILCLFFVEALHPGDSRPEGIARILETKAEHEVARASAKCKTADPKALAIIARISRGDINATLLSCAKTTSFRFCQLTPR